MKQNRNSAPLHFGVILLIFLFLPFMSGTCQDTVLISVSGDSALYAVSPLLFGKNNSLSDAPGKPLSPQQWQRLRDLGIRMFRENGGNNSTKYNWRRKLTSHPDWYNNVYSHDWDYAALSLQTYIPSAQGMWAFQLIGKAALTSSANFNDWGYNGSQWWDGVNQNLCGGGEVNPAGGSQALTGGNIDLYLEDWPADSTTGILDHWFGDSGTGLDPGKIRYWSMDNESEIWSGTHDDVYPVQPTAEEYMQKYFAVAEKARAKYPGIKLLGPVPANEWQWYNWDNNKISYNGKEYVWLEYFILRIAEEEALTGMRLLDVLDIHFYPGETSPADIVQLHRVFFDEGYIYPGANGVKRSGAGGWDNNIRNEYIFGRCSQWLEQYLGPDHGVTFSVSETGINGNDPNVSAVWYASTLGEFEKQGVEIFTPWSWKTGMDEVIHLFSRYGLPSYAAGSSSDEEFVSVYPNINNSKDSMTIFLVNRHLTAVKDLKMALDSFHCENGSHPLFSLYGLPQGETFTSHTQNALKELSMEAFDDTLRGSLPPLSISALLLVRAPEDTTDHSGEDTVTVDHHIPNRIAGSFFVYPNPCRENVSVTLPQAGKGFVMLEVFNATGKCLSSRRHEVRAGSEQTFTISMGSVPPGIYWIRMTNGDLCDVKKLVKY